jgi:integrase
MAKFGSLRKLPSGRWQARYTDHSTGRMISAPDTFRTKSDASAWLAARRADIDRGLITNDVAARLPLSAYWDDYLPSIEVRLRPSSVRDYSYSWSKWIEPRFGAVPVSKILPRDIDRWMADMQAKGMSAQKVRSAFGVLSRLLDRAVRDGAIPVNPASRRSDPLPRVRRVDRPVLTVAQVEDLVTHFEHEDDRVMVRLLAYGGLRIGEALALQRQDVDLKRGLLHVQRSVSDAGGVVRVNDTKTGRDRWVALPASLVAQLRELLRDRPINADALLFPNSDGGGSCPPVWPDLGRHAGRGRVSEVGVYSKGCGCWVLVRYAGRNHCSYAIPSEQWLTRCARTAARSWRPRTAATSPRSPVDPAAANVVSRTSA